VYLEANELIREIQDTSEHWPKLCGDILSSLSGRQGETDGRFLDVSDDRSMDGARNNRE
jgi:hypothetical protein